MKVMLAEDIGGWLLASALTFGAIIGTILGIVAAFPAKKGNRLAATILAAPGLLAAISSTLVCGYAIICDRFFGIKDAVIFWLAITLPPLIVSGLVMLAAWAGNKK
jgi:hypothetical protein